jgi:hypothetical protein
VHGLLDDDLGRRLAAPQLGRREAEDAALDHAESLEAPVGRDLRELAVDGVAFLHHDRRRAARPCAAPRADAQVVPRLGRHALEPLAPTHVPRVERLQRAARARLSRRAISPRPRRVAAGQLALRIGGRVELREQVGHLHRGHRRVPALVAVRAARARLRLLHGVGGQQPERDRHVVLGARVGDSARRLAGDEVEVRRLAAHDGAHGDDGVVALAGEHATHRGGQLPRARDPHDVDVLDAGPVARERVDRALGELLRHGLVEAAGDDREAASLAAGRADELGHGAWVGVGRKYNRQGAAVHDSRTPVTTR